MVIETSSKISGNRYIVANANRVAQWLRYLFKNHKSFIQMEQNDELELSLSIIRTLESPTELAKVLQEIEMDEVDTAESDHVAQPELESGFSHTDVYAFDKYPHLYLRAKEILKIQQEGKIEIVPATATRRPTYGASANLAFPYLYANGEMSPLDFNSYRLARQLLKRQSLFAHRMADGKYAWNYAEDVIHMMHQ
jgi:hypothetical protein